MHAFLADVRLRFILREFDGWLANLWNVKLASLLTLTELLTVDLKIFRWTFESTYWQRMFWPSLVGTSMRSFVPLFRYSLPHCCCKLGWATCVRQLYPAWAGWLKLNVQPSRNQDYISLSKESAYTLSLYKVRNLYDGIDIDFKPCQHIQRFPYFEVFSQYHVAFGWYRQDKVSSMGVDVVLVYPAIGALTLTSFSCGFHGFILTLLLSNNT